MVEAVSRMLFVERVRTQAGLLWMTHFSSDGEENLGLVQRDDLNRTYRENISPSSSQSEHDEEDTENTQPRITTWEAGWNVTNAIQGIFVLGLPYAVLQSGYTGLLLLVLSALLCCYTGKILISCLYEEDEGGRSRRVRHTYADIADACWCRLCPRLGGKLVNVAQVVELMMTCILYLVVSSNLMGHSFPFLPLTPATCSALTFLTLMPCMLIRDLKVVSQLSFLCSLAHFLITFVVIGYCLRQAPRWTYGGLRLAVDFDSFLVAAGVIIFSYTSQIFLPTLEGCMADRGQFRGMMDWTHALACVLKAAFSLLALLTWGEDTKEVVSDNLPPALRMMVNLCLLAKALLSYPLPFYSAAQLLQTGVLRTDTGQYERSVGPEWHTLVLRASLLFLSFVMALYIPHFSLLMGLTGSVTGAVMTLLLPALFHLQLKWSRLSAAGKLLDAVILGLGCICSLAGVIRSIRAMIHAFAST
ncbi:vesicular inhibitory amino acid transporter [Colossoma macropomum]|uniref:vesicular inhibitory amino acid transporter n=1 Tax=Colossoma macropomum TaxID=42526 RepID=UPI001865516C|nr:vesicular inhibitory amino acid transporter [Colossoma macropomum]